MKARKASSSTILNSIRTLALIGALFSNQALVAEKDFWEGLGQVLEAVSEGLEQSNVRQEATTSKSYGAQTKSSKKRDWEDAKIDFMVSLEQTKEAWGEPVRVSNKGRRFEFTNEYGDICILYQDRNENTVLQALKLGSGLEVSNYRVKHFIKPSFPSYYWKNIGYNEVINGKRTDSTFENYRYISSHGKYVAFAMGSGVYYYDTFIVFDAALYELATGEGFNPFSWGNNDPIDDYLYGTDSYAETPRVDTGHNRGSNPESNDRIFKRGQWEILVNTGDTLFPSLIIGLTQANRNRSDQDYHGDILGQIGIEIASGGMNEEVAVNVYSTSFIRPSSTTTRLGRAGEKKKIYPLLEYDYEKLLKLRQPQPETITVEVTRNGRTERRKKLVYFRSINDCPLLPGVKMENGQGLDQLFASYVNENHPIVDKILKEALDSSFIDAFVGYQGGSPEKVDEQVAAIWCALQTQGVKYSSITEPSLVGKIPSQHVRFIHESWENSQANCVDGSVLICSLLRKIGINSELILIPGHCFVAYDLDQFGKQKRYLETTMVGKVNLMEEPDPLFRAADSMVSFLLALEAGAETAKKELFRSFVGGRRSILRVDIREARKNGFLPLSVQ